MATAWGALDVDSADAAREVLEHTVVASLARVSACFHESPERFAVAWLTAIPGRIADATADPAAFLRWMSGVSEFLRTGGAAALWYGPGTFVWPMAAPDRHTASAAAAALVAAGTRLGLVLHCGIAHGTEADDPGDLLRLAAYRSGLSAADLSADDASLPMTPVEFPVSDGERARLSLIAHNRARETGPLVREALDLLLARYS